MIKYKFIAFIYELKVERTMNRGTKIFGDLRISNNSEKISKMFHHDFKNAIGRLEYDYLSTGAYFYLEGEANDNIFEEDTLGLNLLNNFMEKIQFVNNCFWLIKDNSIHIENAYLQLENGDKTKFHSNSRTAVFSNSKGEREEVTFSIEELKSPEKIFDITYRGNSSIDGIMPDLVPLYMGSRVERAFYLLQAARSQSYLPERISIFITLLETLFSTTNTDVTYKLRERVAWILGKDFDERKDIFDDMGIIYDIRSKHVHGSTVSSKAKTKEDLVKYSVRLEEYVREILIKILTEEKIYKLYRKNDKGKFDDHELEKFLKEICLGKSQN